MLRISIVGAGFFIASTMAPLAQMQRISCQTRGPDILFSQNSRTELESTMDQNGCRYSYTMSRSTLEKAVIMKSPANGDLSQAGAFSFFYKPKAGFKGKDNFTVYICSTGRTNSGGGCARLNYNVTVQ